MNGMTKWMLGAVVVAGGLGLGVRTAQAAESGVYARGPVAYVPPCPGPGYFWVDGYQSDGYWIPGRWEFRGDYGRRGFGWFGRDRDRGWEFDRRHDRDRDRDFDRRDDRRDDRRHDRDRDHDRDGHRDRR